MTALYCAGREHGHEQAASRESVAARARRGQAAAQRTKVPLMFSRPPMSSSDTSMTAGLTTSSASTCSGLPRGQHADQ